jgi:peptide/nickel transport system permease protein
MPAMPFEIVILWTDWAVFFLLAAGVAYVWRVRARADLRARWRRVFADPVAMGCATVLGALLAVAVLDSLHFRLALPQRAGASAAYDTKTLSVLDLTLKHLIDSREDSYSAPLATHGFVKLSVPGHPELPRAFPRLKHAAAGLPDSGRGWRADVGRRLAQGLALGVALSAALWGAAAGMRRRAPGGMPAAETNSHPPFAHPLPWRVAVWTGCALCLLGSVVGVLAAGYHVLGTDRTGNDVLYLSLKSVRTAFVIGGLTELAMLPFALVLGIMAGYFKGWVDEVIQYVYTVVSSVPSILLIAACVLMVQVFLDQNPDLFETGLQRADVKLLFLCVILGVTGWAGMCRLLRAETMKLRELEYVQAAEAFGVSHARIMRRHILPNVMHLVLITTVLDFSGMILYEAVLTYVGIGVDPSMNSFGVMINQARIEMSREPAVWWSFAAAFVFMVAIVLCVNLFADAVREAFDPRARALRPRLALNTPR